jgi:hypothetical protein
MLGGKGKGGRVGQRESPSGTEVSPCLRVANLQKIFFCIMYCIMYYVFRSLQQSERESETKRERQAGAHIRRYLCSGRQLPTTGLGSRSE